jgi:branched-chain amino acid transport system substrate-binding protein
MRHNAAAALVGLALILALEARGAETVKLAVFEPFTGAAAASAEANLHHAQAVVDRINAAGGVLDGHQLELVPYDTKLNPQDGMLGVKLVADRGIRIILLGLSSSVAGAVSDAVAKLNARNPDTPILLLNHIALDPELTNAKCHYYHFRFAANADMFVRALAARAGQQPAIRRVYLVNQDYSWGHSFSQGLKAALAQRRPDIEIVGDDLHPLAKVKDFSPYVAKIKASGADTVMTGNWANDLTLLVRAGREAGLKARMYSVAAQFKGTPTALGSAGADSVTNFAHWVSDAASPASREFAVAFRSKYREDWWHEALKITLEMFVRAVNQAGSTNPAKVAAALEGMRYSSDIGEVWMRADDHQLQLPVYVATFARAGEKGVTLDVEGTGFGWRPEVKIEAADLMAPTTCRMQRP